MATYRTHLSRIAHDHFLWIMGGPRPDYLVEEHAADPADLSERLRAARGEGITLGLHPVLALQLETLVQTWQEAQVQNNCQRLRNVGSSHAMRNELSLSKEVAPDRSSLYPWLRNGSGTFTRLQACHRRREAG